MIPIPIGTDRPLRRFPWMNVLLIAANVIVYIISHPATPSHSLLTSVLAPSWDGWMLNPAHPRLYQFITYQFLHQNIGHIFFNMLFLYVFGNNLNEKIGHVGYVAFYLAGGVLAGCGQLLTSSAPTLGASGAISAVTGLFFVLLPRTNIRIFILIFVYADIWDLPSIYFILFKIGQDAIEPLLGPSNVAHMAHLSGTFVGIAVGFFLIFTGLVQRDHYDLLAMINRFRRRKQYESLVARGYQPFAHGGTVAADEESNAGTGGGGREGKGFGARRLKKTPVPPPADPRVWQLRDAITTLIREHQFPAAAAKYLELRALDPTQVLAAQDQLDVANQLMTDGKHAEAAAAYEDYLRAHPQHARHNDQVPLVLSLIYARYVPNAPRAIELLQRLIPNMHDVRQKEMAEAELAALLASAPPPEPPAAGASPHPRPPA